MSQLVISFKTEIFIYKHNKGSQYGSPNIPK